MTSSSKKQELPANERSSQVCDCRVSCRAGAPVVAMGEEFDTAECYKNKRYLAVESKSEHFAQLTTTGSQHEICQAGPLVPGKTESE